MFPIMTINIRRVSEEPDEIQHAYSVKDINDANTLHVVNVQLSTRIEQYRVLANKDRPATSTNGGRVRRGEGRLQLGVGI